MNFHFILLITLINQYASICPRVVALSMRNRRFAGSQQNKKYQECRTPAGEIGHCKHAQHCPLPELKPNSLRFLDYLCVIEQSTIGVCCPDSLSDKIQPSTMFFPQRADDETIVWNSDDIARGRDSGSQSNIIRPEDRGCGLPTKSYSKIVGGRPSEWPWMAAIIRRGYPHIFCGAVLITDRHVLTAAHCVYKYNKNEITVRLGEYNYVKKNETRARDFRVIDIRPHDDFDEMTYEYDIAIIKLHQPALFNSYIWPVCMPPTDGRFEGYKGIVTGWGSQFFGGPNSDVLMEVSVPIWNNGDCQKVFVEHIGENMLCAGEMEGGADSCQGDSGGPLIAQLPNKRWITIGIVSYGIRCGEKNRPGIYTRVNSFSSWIVENAIF